MTIRRDPIYVSSEVWRWLRLLAKSVNASRQGTGAGIATPDEIADTLLRQTITSRHPGIVEFHEEIEALEKKLIKALSRDETI